MLFSQVPVGDRKVLSELVDKIRHKKENIVAVLIGESETSSKPMIIGVSKNLKEVHAGNLTKELCSILDGKGGGRPDFSQGSIVNLDRLPEAKEKLSELIQ